MDYDAWIQTATALGKLGHPDGELNLTRAAAKYNIIQMVGNFDPSVARQVTLVSRRSPPLRRAHLTR